MTVVYIFCIVQYCADIPSVYPFLSSYPVWVKCAEYKRFLEVFEQLSPFKQCHSYWWLMFINWSDILVITERVKYPKKLPNSRYRYNISLNANSTQIYVRPSQEEWHYKSLSDENLSKTQSTRYENMFHFISMQLQSRTAFNFLCDDAI